MRKVRTFSEYKSLLLAHMPIYENCFGKEKVNRKEDALWLDEVHIGRRTIDIVKKGGKNFSRYPLDCEWKLLKGKVFTEDYRTAFDNGWRWKFA